MRHHFNMRGSRCAICEERLRSMCGGFDAMGRAIARGGYNEPLLQSRKNVKAIANKLKIRVDTGRDTCGTCSAVEIC